MLILLILGGFALFGPSGVLVWSETHRLLDERQAQLAQLETERDALRNRVALLKPGQVDPDLGGELLRSQLNVAHPDEMVIVLD